MAIKNRTLYGFITAGGFVGMIAAALQNIEKMQLLKSADKVLSCDINAIFNCSTVLNAWQSSVFGFPNSIMCLIFFTIFASIGLVGLSGGSLPRKLRLAIHGLSLFVLGFAIWFLGQSIFSIQAMCILCLFCFAALLFVNWAWIRINVEDLPISSHARNLVRRAIKNDIDSFIWIVIATVMAFTILIKFYL